MVTQILILFCVLVCTCLGARPAVAPPIPCVPYVVNSTCSSECGPGYYRSVTKYFKIYDDEPCLESEEVIYYPCVGPRCSYGQKCVLGLCTPHWHWHYPKSPPPNNQTYKLETIPIHQKLPSHALLFHNVTTWIKFSIIHLDITVSWSKDGLTWSNKTILELPLNMNRKVAESFLRIYSDLDIDTGILYVSASYATTSQRLSTCMWIINGIGNHSLLDFPQYSDNSVGLIALKGEMYLFFQDMNELKYQTLNGSVWNVPIINEFVLHYYSVSKMTDSILIMSHGKVFPATKRLIVYLSNLYPNGSTTVPRLAHDINADRIKIVAKQKSDLRVLVVHQPNTFFTITTSNYSDWSNNITTNMTLPPFINSFPSTLDIVFGSNNTIMVLLTAFYDNNPFHMKDVYYTLSINSGNNWTPLNNIVAKNSSSYFSDDFSSITSDGNGKWLSVWFQHNSSITDYISEATSFYFIDLNCLDNENCYAFDGEFFYPPRNINSFPINPPNGTLFVHGFKNLTIASSSTVNGGLIINKSNVIFKSNTSLDVKGEMIWSGNMFLDGFGQVIYVNGCIKIEDLYLNANNLIENQPLFKVVVGSDCKDLPSLLIIGEECMRATPVYIRNGTRTIIDFVTTQKCPTDFLLTIVLPVCLVIVFLVVLIGILIYNVPLLKKKFFPYRDIRKRKTNDPSKVRSAPYDKYET